MHRVCSPWWWSTPVRPGPFGDHWRCCMSIVRIYMPDLGFFWWHLLCEWTVLMWCSSPPARCVGAFGIWTLAEGHRPWFLFVDGVLTWGWLCLLYFYHAFGVERVDEDKGPATMLAHLLVCEASGRHPMIICRWTVGSTVYWDAERLAYVDVDCGVVWLPCIAVLGIEHFLQVGPCVHLIPNLHQCQCIFTSRPWFSTVLVSQLRGLYQWPGRVTHHQQLILSTLMNWYSFISHGNSYPNSCKFLL